MFINVKDLKYRGSYNVLTNFEVFNSNTSNKINMTKINNHIPLLRLFYSYYDGRIFIGNPAVDDFVSSKRVRKVETMKQKRFNSLV